MSVATLSSFANPACKAWIGRHSNVLDSISIGDLAVTKTGYILQWLGDGTWRVKSDGMQYSGLFRVDYEVSDAEVISRLGGIVRRADVFPCEAPQDATPCTLTTEDEFVNGQPVSFLALDGTMAVAKYTRAGRGQAVGSLEAWGRKKCAVVYGEEEARSYFQTLAIVFGMECAT
jgi:hypothetical protein